MSTEDDKALIHRLYDAFNRRAIGELDDLLAPAFTDNTASPGQASGRAGMKDVWSYMFGLHPAIRAMVRDVLAEDDKVATRVTFEGLSAPSDSVTMLEIAIVRVADGQIVELWNLVKEEAPQANQETHDQEPPWLQEVEGLCADPDALIGPITFISSDDLVGRLE